MFISRVNRLFERHGRAAFLIIGIVIIIPFVFFVTPGKRGGGKQFRGGDIGEMYGRTIDRDTFFQNYHAADIAILMRWGQLPSQNPQLSGLLIQETLKRIRAIKEARIRGLDQVGASEITDMVRDHWLFQEEGKFSQARFSRFKENLLAPRSIDGARFDDIIRENIMINRLEEQITAKVFVSPEELRQEFNQANETFHIRHCEFKYFDLMQESQLEPSPEQVKNYFDKHRTELRLPDQKKIRVAMLTPELFAAKVKISDQEARQYYERNKARLYVPQKKSFESVKKEIHERLGRSKAREKAAKAARKLTTALAEASKKSPEQIPGELFAALCKKSTIETKDSGLFGKDGEIPNVGKFARLQKKALTLTKESPFTNAVYDSGNYFVACWLQTVPGKTPTTLIDAVSEDIKAKIIRDEARGFYQEKVEKYRDKITTGKTPADLAKDYAADVGMMTDKSDEEKNTLRQEFNQELNDHLQPYYVPEQRKVKIVTFSPRTFRPLVTLNGADIKAYYDSNQAEYSKEEVRAREILLKIPSDAKDDAKGTVHKKMEGILKQIEKGKDFAALAKTLSEDPAGKRKGGDLGYFARGAKAKALEDAAFALEKGQISKIIESETGYHLLKLEDKRQGRTLEEVKSEIRVKLTTEKAEQMADDAAAEFGYNAFETLEKADDTVTAADVFAKLADEKKHLVKDTGWFRERGAIPPFGWQPALGKEAYKLNEANPLSNVIKGKSDFYIACWQGTKPAYLPLFDKESGLPMRVERHVKRNRTLELAREKARSAKQEIAKKLAAGEPLEKAIGELKFEKVPDFTRKQPPSGINQAREIVKLVSDQKTGTLLEPIETNTGSMLVYLEARVTPTDEKFKTDRDMFEKQLKRQKENDVMRNFYKQLEDDSDTILSEAWAKKDKQPGR